MLFRTHGGNSCLCGPASTSIVFNTVRSDYLPGFVGIVITELSEGW